MEVRGIPREDFEGWVVQPVMQSAVHQEAEVEVTHCHMFGCSSCAIGKCVGQRRVVASDCHRISVLQEPLK